ncbi:predicted protein [Naegleria gruberi]|uniref:Predicted protein n=1 Tax=Naegleria gruberi TaxID=5762 RepID=D2VD46_NAEGR|nr:uncharacterized protein NAEGRDRAFT_57857 [Naegleria gruberi]EFC45171.1 predicted protein [Naegleria gruberi]|eukprot:XP_002677915.1 predicted protein [Naegleria gruberi strain NEG-M]
MNILFLVDTSSSMNQLTTNGMKLIDISKHCIEHFIKNRQKHLMHQQKRDNYLLVTSGQKVVVGWKDATESSCFLQRLKSLKANDLTEIGPSLKKSFDVLNQHRLQKGVDHYGMGRHASAVENSAIVLITDGERLTQSVNPFDQRVFVNQFLDANKLTLPNPHSYSTKLTEEPFRWDQRVFSIILQFQAVGTSLTTVSPSASLNPSLANQQQQQANLTNQTPTITDNPIAPISEVTGGLSRTFSNMVSLLKFMDDLSGVQLARPSVVVNFDIVKTLNNKQSSVFPPTNNEGLGKTVLQYITQPQQRESFWPIPENYLPGANMTELPTRRAQPSISLLYTEKNDILLTMALNKFPIYDIFEISTQSPIGKYVIQQSSREGCYKAFVTNSTPSNYGFGESFGFLKKIAVQNSTGEVENKIYFYLLPYNFLRLFYLMNEFVVTHKSQPSAAWIQQFHKFVQNLPAYYIKPLKSAMNKWFGAFAHFPDVPYELPSSLQLYYKQLVDEEKRFNKDMELEESGSSTNVNLPNDSLPKNDDQMQDPPSFPIISFTNPYVAKKETNNLIRNPFDIDKTSLLKQMKMMSQYLFHSVVVEVPEDADHSKIPLDQHLRDLSKEEIKKHSTPISQMGNFDKVLLSKEVLRDPFEPQKQKQVNFGSPYQKKKKRLRSIHMNAPLLLDKLVDESEMDLKQKEEEESSEFDAKVESMLLLEPNIADSNVSSIPVEPSSAPLETHEPFETELEKIEPVPPIIEDAVPIIVDDLL